jgi:phosphatidylglycerol:prolipoprotein diacylglycerol transferase
MRQLIIDFGQVHGIGLRIYGYGLMLVLGFVFAILLARWRARRFGEDPDVITSVGLLALVGGVVGARIAFVIEGWHGQFSRSPNPLADMLNITSGGLIYYGGVVLACLIVIPYLYFKKLPARRYLDILAPSLMIGLAFGRAGCLLNGCCYGGRCNEAYPLAMHFPYASKPLILLDNKANIFGSAGVSPLFASQFALRADDSRCPITGMKADPKIPTATFDGKTVRFCSAECPPKWSALSPLEKEDKLRAVMFDLPAWLVDWRPVAKLDYFPVPVLKSPAELTGEQARAAAGIHSLAVQPAQPLAIINALLVAGILVAFTRLRRREGQVFLLLMLLYPVVRFIEESLRGDNAHDLFNLVFTHNQYTSAITFVIGILLWLSLRLLPASAGPFRRARQLAVETAALAPARKK